MVLMNVPDEAAAKQQQQQQQQQTTWWFHLLEKQNSWRANDEFGFGAFENFGHDGNLESDADDVDQPTADGQRAGKQAAAFEQRALFKDVVARDSVVTSIGGGTSRGDDAVAGTVAAILATTAKSRPSEASS